jgi:peptidoglycan/LPS O-acetylase OafA/YrhL
VGGWNWPFAGRSSETIGQALDRQKGFATGFDVLRWALAFLIFYGHCKGLAGSYSVKTANTVVSTLTERGWAGFRRPYQVALVPMFFALSGFLVTASALRVRDVTTFLALRSLRIFPALTVEVVLSALILGPLLTVYSLDDYFGSRMFLTYFGNILGFVQFELPGVFLTNPSPGVVNANLWTLPSEFYCYLVTAIAMTGGLMFSRASYTLIFAVVTVVSVVLSLTTTFGDSETTVGVPVLVYYFFAGGLLYHWRDAIPRDGRLFAVAVIAAYALLYSRETVYLAPLAVVYVTVYLGLFHHDKLVALRKADYSYGIYLYGYPITQGLLVQYPQLLGHGYRLAAISAFCTLCFAALSWHFIEAPMLKLKSRLLGPRRPAPAQASVAASLPLAA